MSIIGGLAVIAFLAGCGGVVAFCERYVAAKHLLPWRPHGR